MAHRTILAFVVATAWAGQVPAIADDDPSRLDCGVNALYLLLQFEGRPATVGRILAALPAHDPEGYSMAELAAASEALGLALDGVRFAEGDPIPGRSAIAFIQDARGGHFTVLRPVGSTGAMVQVIDPPAPPWIADYDELFVGGSWTNRILVPRLPWYSTVSAIGWAALAGVAAFVISSAAALRIRSRVVDGTLPRSAP